MWAQTYSVLYLPAKHSNKVRFSGLSRYMHRRRLLLPPKCCRFAALLNMAHTNPTSRALRGSFRIGRDALPFREEALQALGRRCPVSRCVREIVPEFPEQATRFRQDPQMTEMNSRNDVAGRVRWRE